jgi:hypothetical protein
VREPDGEQLAPLLRAPGLDARLAKPSTAAEALVAGAAHARGARHHARPSDVPDELRASLRLLESAFRLPGLDAAVDRAVRRQIAVIEGELRAYARGLDVLDPLLRSHETDPTILRIAARLLEKLDRGAEARALLDRAALEDFRK